jgi:hypothetical protein
MRQTILFLILLVLLPVSVAVQDLLPGIPPAQERLLLLPVVFAFGVLALPLVPALWFALLTAIVQGLALLQVQSGQAEMGLIVPVVFFLVWAIVLQMASEATHGMRWELHALGSALVTLTQLGGEFLLLCARRGGFPLDAAVLLKLAVPPAAALLLAPLLYLLLRSLVPLAPSPAEPSTAPRQPGFGL